MTIERWPAELLEWVGVATHVHLLRRQRTNMCGGTQSAAQVVAHAKAVGLSGVAFNSHSSDSTAPVRLSPNSWLWRVLLNEAHVAAQLQANEPQFLILSGTEANMLPSGELDIPTGPRATRLGYVIASQHAGLGDEEKDPAAIVRRIARVAREERADAWGHPLRHIDEVKGLDWPRMLADLTASNTAVEVNLNSFKRLEGSLSAWYKFFVALREAGTPIVIGGDIHNFGMWPTATPTEFWHTTLTHFTQLIDTMVWAGLTKGQVLNATAGRFGDWLGAPKPERSQLVSW